MDDNILYDLYLHGGPDDGLTIMSPRPYDILWKNGVKYSARCKGPDCVDWVDDDKRRIDLYIEGYEQMPSVPKGTVIDEAGKPVI